MAGEQKADFSLKEIKPNIGGGRVSGREKLTSSFDLVEETHILFVRVVKARELRWSNGGDTSTCDHPFVEIRIGNYKATTKHMENKKPNPEWNQVFAFNKERIQALSVDFTVRDRRFVINDDDQFSGKIDINVSDIPTRVPPDSPLAPQWYKLEDKNGATVGSGELMLVAWFGTQADEVFPDAWHSDVAAVGGESIPNTRSKVYLSPRLWYLRVNIIQAQDLVARSDKNRNTPEVYVKATLGNVSLRTRVSPDKSVNPKWNEDLMFVAAEPFDFPLILTVEDKPASNKEESLGKCVIPLSKVNKRWLPEPVGAKWYNLEQVFVDGSAAGDQAKKFASKLNMRISLDGGYHVFDESIHCSSDYRPTQKSLWTPVIGLLELGIIGASGLVPMKSRDGRQTTDPYCVAKYGPKWIRTRTAVDSLCPKWNEQYNWEVYDPYTVLLVGMFDNCHLHGDTYSKDPSIGKLRIRLSALSTNRVYTYSYPLIALQPSGVKKMGEIQLAIRFTCPSYTNLLAAYARPLFPSMHYTHPLSVYQLDSLRQQATFILSLRLSRTEPPLRKEVVECMLDAAVGSQMWSMRRGKANFQRLTAAFSVFVEAWKWLDQIRKWKNPAANLVLVLLYSIVLFRPNLLMPTLLSYSFLVGIWQYRKRRRHPPHIDIKLSLAEDPTIDADDLDEELDTFPSSKQGDVLRMRYDRLRSIAGRVMVMVGDLAAQGERFGSGLSWQDPRATAIFLTFCLFGALLLYSTMIPLKWVLLVAGLYAMRSPRFRINVPTVAQNVFRRLPTRTDQLL